MRMYLRNPHPIDLSDFFNGSEFKFDENSHKDVRKDGVLPEVSMASRHMVKGLHKISTRVSEKLFSFDLKNIKF